MKTKNNKMHNMFSRFNNHLLLKHKKRMNKRMLRFKLKEDKRNLRIKLKEEKKAHKIKYHEKLTNLKISEDINVKKLLSDNKTFKQLGKFKRLKAKLLGSIYIRCRIRYPDGIDIIRFYPMIKPYVLEIGGDLYQFSPKSFRYENNNMFLEFHYSNPFAVVYVPSDSPHNTFKPTFDAHSFKNIMESKIIEDMLKQEDDKQNWILLAVAGLVLINFIITIYNSSMLGAIKKALAPANP